MEEQHALLFNRHMIVCHQLKLASLLEMPLVPYIITFNCGIFHENILAFFCETEVRSLSVKGGKKHDQVSLA